MSILNGQPVNAAASNPAWVGQEYFLEGFTTTVTAASTTTLTVSSTSLQEFTGSTTQICKLPDATTLVAGRIFRVMNVSTGIVTVNYNDSTTLTTVPAGESFWIICKTIATSNGTWDFDSPASGISVGTYSNTSTAKGLDITGGVLTLHSADGTNPGALSTVSQTIAGVKNFTSSTNNGSSYTLGVLGSASGSLVDENDTSKSISINADPGNSGASSILLFRVDGTTAVTIDSSQNTTFSGNSISPAHVSSSSNPSTAGAIRLATLDAINWRNNANSGNVALSKNTSDQLTYAGTSVLSSTGVLLVTAAPAFTGGDVTSSAGSFNLSVAKISGVTVSGTTGTGNVVFSASPVTTGTLQSDTAYATTALRVANNGALSHTSETATILQSVSTDTNSAGIDVDLRATFDGNTAQAFDNLFIFRRQINTTSRTDSGSQYSPLRTRHSFTVNGSAVLTAGALLYQGILVDSPTITGSGTLALTDFAGVQINSSNLNTGTNKYGIYVGSQTGATNNYAIHCVGAVNSTSQFTLGPVGGASGAITDENDTSKSISIGADPGNAGSASFISFKVDSAEKLRINSSGQLVFGTAGNETTGAGTALLSTNCPAVTPTAPYKWLTVILSDASTAYIPVWK